MRSVIPLITATLLVALPSTTNATGDIYVGTDAHGNVFFTDTPPTYRGFARFLKQASRSGSQWSRFRQNFNHYNDLVTHHAATNGVDAALVKAIIFAESAFNPNAVSRAGAEGLMQLMPHVQQSLGVTDSFDPAQNIDGGARLLSELMKRYKGNERLALAAYNAGPTAVDNYGGVPPYPETQGYVDKVIAMTQHLRIAGLATPP